jgi:hypothetical protein
MKRPALLLALPVLALLAPAARAGTADLGTHGVLTLRLPPGWTMSSKPEQDAGTVITLAPPGDAKAAGLINVSLIPAAAEPVTREQIKEQTLAVADQFVEASVEKKKTLRELTVANGDASLVGQPPKKGEFKVVGVGIVHYRDDVVAEMGLSADDEKGPEFTALLDIVGSATLSAAK